MTKYDENELRSPNEADLILTNLKDKLNIRFDKDLSNTLGINHYDLGNWRRRGSIPKDWYVRIKRDYLNDLEIQVPEKTKKINKGKEKIEMYEYVIELQKEKIESQANKILALEKKLSNQPVHLTDGKIPSWSDIIFDVKTKQTYKAGRYDTFEKYEMVHYQDFYRKLGYSELEAEKYWKVHYKFMTSDRIERNTNYNVIETMGFKVNPDKTDTSITDPKETQKHFEMAMKNNIVNQLQIYNACYIGKDGSEAHAVISVLFDFVNHQSESKIKFLANN